MSAILSKTNEINNLTKSRAYKLEIYSFSANRKVEFPAFIKDFNDSFKSTWDKVQVYGRMDPIATFKNTTRVITLSFEVPNDTFEMAFQNLVKLNGIIQGLYPIYDGGKYGTATISSPPMFRVRFANLIKNINNLDDEQTLKSGLLCFMDGFDFKPVTENGFFIQDDNVLPKLLTVSMTLNIIHEHPLGNQKGADGEIEGRKEFYIFPHLNFQKGKKESATTFLGESIESTATQPNDEAEDVASQAAEEEITGTG